MNTAGKTQSIFARCAVTVMLLLAAPVHAIDFGAFGNVRYVSSNAEMASTGFMLGGFDLFATQQISENTRAFVEYVFESGDAGIVIDLERLSVQHEISEKFRIAAGRFHTPIGYWNSFYHHGTLLQDTTGRPNFLDFEDGDHAILPTHIVGMMVSGDLGAGSFRVGYDLGVGNGGSINTDIPDSAARELEMNNVGDPNNSKAIAARINFMPDDSGVHFGWFTVYNNIAESGGAYQGVATGGTLLKQSIQGFDFKYAGSGFDVLGEYYGFSNDNKTGSARKYSATAYFVQTGYQFMKAVKAIYRYEDVAFNIDDAYFTSLLSREAYRQHVLTLRFDLDESSAIKIEIMRHQAKVNSEEARSAVVQWDFLIP